MTIPTPTSPSIPSSSTPTELSNAQQKKLAMKASRVSSTSKESSKSPASSMAPKSGQVETPVKVDTKGKGKEKPKPLAAGSNWAALQKTLTSTAATTAANPKKRKFAQQGIKPSFNRFSELPQDPTSSPSTSTFPRETPNEVVEIAPGHTQVAPGVVFIHPPPTDTALVRELREMIAGRMEVVGNKKLPGNYLAIDCEMVGLGPQGTESALARLSIVNFHGHLILDTFVLPRERVTDWRTWVSGVSEKDMVGARKFEDVQKEVAALVEGKVLVGHAIANDTKALLLSHPSPLIRDTQRFKLIRQALKSKMPGLKKATETLLGVKIQAGVHSSVTDARATMALYRLYKPQWESILHKVTEAYAAKTTPKNKRKAEEVDVAEEGEGGKAKKQRKEVKVHSGKGDAKRAAERDDSWWE